MKAISQLCWKNPRDNFDKQNPLAHLAIMNEVGFFFFFKYMQGFFNIRKSINRRKIIPWTLKRYSNLISILDKFIN